MKALITGASSGIGKEIAKELSAKGYELVLVARNETNLKKLKEELENKDKTKIETISIDLSKEENCKELHKKVQNVDILVNNAGFGDCGNFTKTELSKEIQMINTNITAYHMLTKLYLIDMKKKNSGKILNVASIAGFMPGPLMSTYYATKAYIVRLSEGIKEELKKEKSKVQISILCPGPVSTNFNETANVKFFLRQANCEKVVKYTIKKLEKGKFYIIPGIDIKLAKILVKITPSNIVAKITYMIQKKKHKGRRKNVSYESKGGIIMKYFKKLVGEKIYLSPINIEDALMYTKWLNDFKTSDYIGRSSQIYTLEAEKEWVKEQGKGEYIFSIIDIENDKLIGNCGFIQKDNINRTGTLGIIIGEEEYREKGIGTEVIKILLDYGFNYLNLKSIYLELLGNNERALKCYKKCGFKEVGKRRQCIYLNGKYYDRIMMDILKEEFTKESIKNKNI